MIHGDGPGITMAQACGEQEYSPLAYVAGIDFDPSDPEEVEHVRMATEADAMRRADRLAEENARLRARLAQLENDEEPDREPSADQERAWDEQYDGTSFGA